LIATILSKSIGWSLPPILSLNKPLLEPAVPPPPPEPQEAYNAVDKLDLSLIVQ